MKNVFKTNLMAAALISSLLGPASQAMAEVKTKTYSVTYTCAVTATDAKKYSVEIKWTSEPSEFSEFPSWDSKLHAEVNDQNNVAVLNTVFYSSGFGAFLKENVGLDFQFDLYKLTGYANKCLRPGCYSSSIDIELLPSYDNDGKQILTLQKFAYSLNGYDHQIIWNYYDDKQVILDIQSSTCTKSK